ncbi:MAG TPA: hypothetical protein VFH97_05685 [Gemmatimonadales bacterium]|nr:hypothetical protein [Gemmatimonadales bacterium]
MRVGSPDDSASAFTWFRDLVVGPAGDVYTLHPTENLIRVHDSTGLFLRSIGGPGEGPGEFKNAGLLGWLGDTLWVLDVGTYRFSYFDAAGGFLGSLRVPIDLGRFPDVRPPRPTGLFADGSIAGAPPAWSKQVASGEIREAVVLRLTPDGAAGDTIATYPIGNSTLEIALPNDPQRRATYGSQPFADGELFALFPGELAYLRLDRRAPEAGPAVARLTKVTFAGDTAYAIALPGTRVPIADAEVDSIVRQQAERAGKFFSDVPGARLEEIVRERLYRPPSRALFEGLVAGADGTVWASRPREPGGTRAWVVVAPDGAIVGEVSLPGGLRVMWARMGQVWGVEYDSLDVPYIVSYHVSGAPGVAGASR